MDPETTAKVESVGSMDLEAAKAQETMTTEASPASDEAKATRPSYKSEWHKAEEKAAALQARLDAIEAEKAAQADAALAEKGEYQTLFEKAKAEAEEAKSSAARAQQRADFMAEAVKQGVRKDSLDDAYRLLTVSEGQSMSEAVTGLLSTRDWLIEKGTPKGIDGGATGSALPPENDGDRLNRIYGNQAKDIFAGGGVVYHGQ